MTGNVGLVVTRRPASHVGRVVDLRLVLLVPVFPQERAASSAAGVCTSTMATLLTVTTRFGLQLFKVYGDNTVPAGEHQIRMEFAATTTASRTATSPDAYTESRSTSATTHTTPATSSAPRSACASRSPVNDLAHNGDHRFDAARPPAPVVGVAGGDSRIASTMPVTASRACFSSASPLVVRGEPLADLPDVHREAWHAAASSHRHRLKLARQPSDLFATRSNELASVPRDG